MLPLLLPGVSVNPGQIARSLVILMLLPLGGALAMNAKWPSTAATIKPALDRVSSLSLIAAALVVANQSFDDPNVVVIVVVIAIVGQFTLMPLRGSVQNRFCGPCRYRSVENMDDFGT